MGKTHLAIALGLLTAEAGHRIYFTTAIEMTPAFVQSPNRKQTPSRTALPQHAVC